MHKDIKAVALDCDGTILDSYVHGQKHLTTVAYACGLEITHKMRQKMLRTWGQPGVEFLQGVFEIGHEHAQFLYRKWEEIDIKDPIPFVDGARATLDWLHDQHFVVCMLTSRHRQNLMEILAREGLQNYFARITAREDTNFHKPDKKSFCGILQTLARQNVRREECLYVGDTCIDIEAGRSAGIETVVVETGPYRDEHYKTHLVPDERVIPSIKFLPNWIISNSLR